jgi:hypothetical protein
VQRGATDIGTIARVSGLSHRAAASAVASLEIEGLLSVDLLGFVRASPAAATPFSRA